MKNKHIIPPISEDQVHVQDLGQNDGVILLKGNNFSCIPNSTKLKCITVIRENEVFDL